MYNLLRSTFDNNWFCAIYHYIKKKVIDYILTLLIVFGVVKKVSQKAYVNELK